MKGITYIFYFFVLFSFQSWQPTDRGLIDPKLICEVK